MKSYISVGEEVYIFESIIKIFRYEIHRAAVSVKQAPKKPTWMLSKTQGSMNKSKDDT